MDDEASDDDEKAEAGVSASDSDSNSDSSGSHSVSCSGQLDCLSGWQVVLYTAPPITVITIIPCLHGLNSSFPTQLLEVGSLLIHLARRCQSGW